MCAQFTTNSLIAFLCLRYRNSEFLSLARNKNPLCPLPFRQRDRGLKTAL